MSSPRSRKADLLLIDKAAQASDLLTAMANPKRLLVMCHLIEGECPVGEMADRVGLSQAALSQHLAKLRAYNLVATPRHGQTIYYSLASDDVRAILQTLYQIYCEPLAKGEAGKSAAARSGKAKAAVKRGGRSVVAKAAARSSV